MARSAHYSKKDLLIELIRTNFKIKNNGSILGFIWVFLQPFFHFVILYFVFKFFRGSNPDENLAPKIMYALITFNFFRDGVIGGSSALLKYSSIITKVYFKRINIIHANLLINIIDFLLNIILITTIFSVFGKINLNLISSFYYLYIIILAVGFVYSLSLVLSIILIIVRDLRNMLKLIFQSLFWLSGIFYDLDSVRYSFRVLIYLNPISYVIDSVKKIVISGEVANLNLILILSLIVALSIPIAQYFFKRNIDKVIEYL
ncbi:hypothetical protein GF362_03435 [Candidatus Dojkabacteria bacterium]|nr:hypothetical protein [Candidatus Dojkabacteria bacterium]